MSREFFVLKIQLTIRYSGSGPITAYFVEASEQETIVGVREVLWRSAIPESQSPDCGHRRSFAHPAHGLVLAGPLDLQHRCSLYARRLSASF